MNYLDKVDRISKLEKTLKMVKSLFSDKDTTNDEKEMLDIIFYRLHREMFEIQTELNY